MESASNKNKGLFVIMGGHVACGYEICFYLKSSSPFPYTLSAVAAAATATAAAATNTNSALFSPCRADWRVDLHFLLLVATTSRCHVEVSAHPP